MWESRPEAAKHLKFGLSHDVMARLRTQRSVDGIADGLA
jgi:hypothetical protein